MFNMSIDYTSYVPLINRIVGKYSKQYREDLYQECFLKLIQIAKGWTQPAEDFIKYAARTLKYVCIDFMNKNRLNNVSLDIEYVDAEGEVWSPIEYVRDSTDMDSHLESKDYLEKIRYVDADLVKIKELYYNHGYTYQEIAENYPELGATSESAVQRIITEL